MIDRKTTKELLAAALRLADARPDRNVPSPSSVSKCTRQNWFKAKGTAKTNQPDNGESVIAAETGRLSEAFLIRVVEEAGLGVPVYVTEDESLRELSAAELEEVSMKGGQVDNIIRPDDGERFLVEFKRKGVFDMLDLLRDGLREAKPDEFIQMQSLMHAKGLTRGLYIAANWDRGSFTSRVRKWDERPDGLYAEWVPYSRPAALAAKVRAEMQTKLIEEEEDPARVPRDYDPFEGKFPCSWCPHWDVCKKVG